jgi:hypothetical protein
LLLCRPCLPLLKLSNSARPPLLQVDWENRLTKEVREAIGIGKKIEYDLCTVSVGSFDFPIVNETLRKAKLRWVEEGMANPDDDDDAFYSEKLRGPAVRYELALSICASDIVFINGPTLPGRCGNDKGGMSVEAMFLADGGLRNKLEEAQERAVASSSGHVFDQEYVNVGDRDERYEQYALAQVQNQNILKKLRSFEVLRQKFRDDMEKHGFCFRAVALILQLAHEGKEKPLNTSAYFEYEDTLTDSELTTMLRL